MVAAVTRVSARFLRFTALALALSTSAVGSTASAQDGAAGEALFAEGKALAAEGKWAEACLKLEASYAADATVGTLLNWADCLEKEGKIGSAYLRFGEAKALLEAAEDGRASVADERRAGLESRVPHLVVRSKTNGGAGISVRVDGAIAPVADVVSPAGHDRVVDPGDHPVEVRRGNRVLMVKKAHVDEGGKAEVELDLADIDRSHPDDVAPPPPPPKEQPSQTPRYIGWALVGTGGLALVGATILEVVALGYQSDSEEVGHCRDGLCTPTGASESSTAGDLAEAGQWVGIGGLGLLAVGVTLVIATPRADASAASPAALPPGGTTVGLRASPGRISLEGAF